MSDKEKTLSDYIDKLNSEEEPKEHEHGVDDSELEEMMSTVRLVKSLKEPALPDSNYHKKVAKAVAGKAAHDSNPKRLSKAWYLGFGTIAAAVIMLLVLNLSFGKNNIIYAMEQAFQEIKSYHGIIEVTEINGEGQNTAQAKREVWANKEGNYYIEELEGTHKGLITVNNGGKKWQLRPDAKEAYIYSAFPDPYRFTFELGNEIENLKKAVETKTVGEETVSGRATVVLEVTPKGGAAYKLWVDKETKLPLKKQSAIQNAIQYTIIYTSIEFIDSIPSELVAYELPTGYEEININNEQLVNNISEAAELVGFEIIVPKNIAVGYKMGSITVEQDKKLVRLYYTSIDKQSKVAVLQGKADGELKPEASAILGKIGSNIAEIQSPIQSSSGVLAGVGAYAGATDISSIRWQKGDFEYAVIGSETVEVLNQFVKGIANSYIQIPQNPSNKPEVEVLVDLTIEENEQKSVDAGHAPWRLDPVFVAQIFVSLEISPEGIQGDYPVKYEDFKVEYNSGSEAVLTLKSDNTPISKVYLKKLIRQDSTGIWSVVGYDTNNK